MRIFVDVDTQHDFCDPAGALSVRGAPLEAFRALVASARLEGSPIVGSVDSHAWDAWEFASNDRRGPGGEKPNFPDHCVKGTPGWLKVDGTLPSRFRFVPNVGGQSIDPLVRELADGSTEALYFEKEVYSLFVNPAAEPALASLSAAAQAKGGAPPTFVVFGVATDYCVRAAAIGLRERGHRTEVVVDAIAPVSAEAGARALAEMEAAGVRMVRLSEVVAR